MDRILIIDGNAFFYNKGKLSVQENWRNWILCKLIDMDIPKDKFTKILNYIQNN